MASPERLLYFVRHGQYAPTPTGGTLTALGRRQAKKTGKRLATLDVAALHASNLSRAAETAELIAEQLGGIRVRTSKVLREMLPTAIRGSRVAMATRASGRANLDTIVERYFRPSRTTRHEVFVCHGNLIRALLCRVMDHRLSKWIRLDIHNGGVTTFSVLPNGLTRLVGFNDFGHLPPKLITEW